MTWLMSSNLDSKLDAQTSRIIIEFDELEFESKSVEKSPAPMMSDDGQLIACSLTLRK
ncbi:hypothetical protein WN943_009453 [Citrus x changshan-huyou]